MRDGLRLARWFLVGLALSAAGCTPRAPAMTDPLFAAATSTIPAWTVTPLPTATPGPAPVINAGFEEPSSGNLPVGWTVTGDAAAMVLEGPGHTGDFRLTHTFTETYHVDTTQRVTGLTNDWYTLGAWVRSSGRQVELYLGLQCGGTEQRVQVPATTPGDRWIHLTVSNPVTDHQCLVRFHSSGTPGSWASVDDIELTPGRVELSVRGADISSLKKSEALGGIYAYRDGTPADALRILQTNGLTYARLRVWVNPADGYHNLAEVLGMARRLKALGIKLLVDIHYSDAWADPGQQAKPAAWKNYSLPQLEQAVYDHTFDVCRQLAAQGTPADMVQIGNEINAGILWPDGDIDHFDNLAALLKSGFQAAKDASPTTQVMLHIADGGNNDMARWFFDHLSRRKVPFDLIGVSYYPIWHGSLAALQANLNDLATRYQTPVAVVEFAYPFTGLDNDAAPNLAGPNLAVEGYPYTPDGQQRMLRDVLAIVRGVPGGRGLGVFYWDATWTAVPGNGWNTQDPTSGNSWENQALFDYQNRALPALEEYRTP